jgi:hypothetical protein
MQALTVLQKQVENYRALKYQPVNPDPLLAGHTLTTVATAVPSANGTLFDVTVSIDNDPYTDGIQTATSAPAVPEADCKFKEITIEATPHNPQSGWLADLKTRVSFRRVRLRSRRRSWSIRAELLIELRQPVFRQKPDSNVF